MTNHLDDRKHMIMLLQKLNRHVTQTFEKRTNISLTRYEILVSLLKKDNVTQKTLQQMLAIDQAAITRHLKILEQQGYIERKRNENNNREILVTILDKGRYAINHCTGFKNQFLEELYEGFSADETEQLKLLLQRLSHNALIL